MDQQRDYDQTLQKMEINKGAQLQWSSPVSPSASITNNIASKSSDPIDTSHRNIVKKPSGPPPPIKKFTFDPSTGNAIPPTHQTVIVQSFNSDQSSNKVNNVLPNSPPFPVSSTSSGNSSNMRPILRPALKKPTQPSPIRQSMHLESVDDDDLEMGEFSTDSTLNSTPFKRPDNIPLLVIPMSPTPSSNKTPVAKVNNISITTSNSIVNKPSQFPPNYHHSSGGSVSGSHPFPSPLKPSTAVHNIVPVPNLGPGPNLVPTPQDLNLPVVKETKDVKRNRAQIPDTLRHAKPNTGNWLNNRYIVNNYILLDVLGTGSYGEVRLCKDRISETLYAIKIISKDFLKKRKNNKTTETYFEDIKREIAIMKKLLHPNILRLFEVLDDPNVNKMYLVLEYMKMGDLVNILKRRPKDENGNVSNESNTSGFSPLSDYEVWNIFRQLASGIKYLHLQNVVHGDIKPQNLLLGEDGVLKVADFGISHMLSASGQKLADAAGTPAFMSPELCEGKPFSGQAADIWAIGATIFMLRFGHPPFIAKNIINLYSKIVNDPLVFPYEIDPGLRNILEHLLEKDPQKRFTMHQITTHPWLRHMPLNPMNIKLSKPPVETHSTLNSTGITTGVTSSVDISNKNEHTLNGKSQSALNLLTFIPPPTYDAEEAAAMKNVITELDNNDLFMSIGGIRKQTQESNSLSNTKSDIDSVFESVKTISLCQLFLAFIYFFLN